MTRLSDDHPAIRATLATPVTRQQAQGIPQVKSPVSVNKKRRSQHSASEATLPLRAYTPPALDGLDDRAALCIIVPLLAPTLNHAYDHITLTSKTGKRYTSKKLSDEALAFRAAVAGEVQAHGWHAPDDALLALHMRVVYPDYRLSDIDNRIKLALDALALACGFNDRRVVAVHGYYGGVRPGEPLTELWLEVV